MLLFPKMMPSAALGMAGDKDTLESWWEMKLEKHELFLGLQGPQPSII